MSKKIWWLIIILVILIITLIGLKKGGVIGKEEGTKVAVEKATKRTIVETVSASGKIYPEDERKVSSDVSGEIVELMVQEGDSVRRGQTLARIYADIYASMKDRANAALAGQQAQVDNAEAQLAAFKARLDQAQNTYNRQKKLYDDKVISRSEFEQAESAYKTALADYNAALQTIRSGKAQIQSAQASLEEANKNLQRTTIVSPMNGIVSLLAVKKGERVVGTAQMAGTEMLRIADMSKIEVQVDVGENDIPKVHYGDTALVEVDAYNDRKFKGVVTQIASSNTGAASQVSAATGDVTTYKVHIRLDPDSYKDLVDPSRPRNLPFRPGMSANADIQTRTQEDVLAVPILAVTTREKNEGDIKAREKELKDKNRAEGIEDVNNISVETDLLEEVVFVVQPDGTVKKVKVATGIQDNEYINVTSGLNEGDEVASAPYNTISKILKDKSKVQIVPKDKLYENQ